LASRSRFPRARELEPRVGIDAFVGIQPYKLVLYSEKTSLREVLGGLAAEHSAVLYLPADEISDTHLYEMAWVGAADGRRMIVVTFSDCDPAGWQMPISIGRKLHAFKTLEFPDLDFEVHRVALTPDQVRVRCERRCGRSFAAGVHKPHHAPDFRQPIAGRGALNSTRPESAVFQAKRNIRHPRVPRIDH
jgi:hypothetical protein